LISVSVDVFILIGCEFDVGGFIGIQRNERALGRQDQDGTLIPHIDLGAFVSSVDVHFVFEVFRLHEVVFRIHLLL